MTGALEEKPPQQANQADSGTKKPGFFSVPGFANRDIGALMILVPVILAVVIPGIVIFYTSVHVMPVTQNASGNLSENVEMACPSGSFMFMIRDPSGNVLQNGEKTCTPDSAMVVAPFASGNVSQSGENDNLPGTVMFVTGLLTVALVFIVFIRFMNRISPTFLTLGKRGILVPGDGVPAFLDETFARMDQPYEWMVAGLFMIIPLIWLVPFEPITPASDPVLLYEYIMEIFIAFLIGLIAWRLIVMGLQIKKIPSRFSLELQPGHPDKCGGLAPLGSLCLHNALIIALPGIYLGGWMTIGPLIGFKAISETYQPIFTLLLLVPILFSAITFFIPLWETHRVMAAKKAEILRNLDELAESLNRKNKDLLSVPENPDPETGINRVQALGEIQAQIASLETIYTQYQKISEWPFNTRIFLQFLTTQAVPVLTLLGVSEPIAGLIASVLGFPGTV